MHWLFWVPSVQSHHFPVSRWMYFSLAEGCPSNLSRESCSPVLRVSEGSRLCKALPGYVCYTLLLLTCLLL